MESLLCAENPVASDGPYAQDDPVLLNNPEVFENMLKDQTSTMIYKNYFITGKNKQKDITPVMRRLVATWMLEVCEEQNCEDQVYGVAINYLDRFLVKISLERGQFQLLGAVCLLLASKIRQCRSLSIELLAYYTENSCTIEEIKKWEIAVVSNLGWDLCPITAGDILEYLIRKVPGASKNSVVKRHATTFVALTATEVEFLMEKPSSIAVASLVAALRGRRFGNWQTCLEDLCNFVHTETSQVEKIVQQIEVMIERASAILPPQNNTNNNDNLEAMETEEGLPLTPPLTPTNKYQQPQPMEIYDGNETPTDVCDIVF